MAAEVLHSPELLRLPNEGIPAKGSTAARTLAPSCSPPTAPSAIHSARVATAALPPVPVAATRSARAAPPPCRPGAAVWRLAGPLAVVGRRLSQERPRWFEALSYEPTPLPVERGSARSWRRRSKYHG